VIRGDHESFISEQDPWPSAIAAGTNIAGEREKVRSTYDFCFVDATSITKCFVAIRHREARNDGCYVLQTETKVKRANLCPLVLLPLAFALSCGESNDEPPPEVLPLEIVLLGDSITVMKGYVDDVAAEFEPGVVWRAGRIGYTTRHWIPGWGISMRHMNSKSTDRGWSWCC
jgi:hypothetical protein